jgi:hypothetical protein
MTNLKRWTDEKLDRERSFAVAANDQSPECIEWLRRIDAEIEHRKTKRAFMAEHDRTVAMLRTWVEG